MQMCEINVAHAHHIIDDLVSKCFSLYWIVEIKHLKYFEKEEVKRQHVLRFIIWTSSPYFNNKQNWFPGERVSL